MKKKHKRLTTKEFDRRAETGKDLADKFDWDKNSNTINMILPEWMSYALKIEADRQGINRNALIKNWLAERLEKLKK